MSNFNINNYKPHREGQHTCFTSTENGCTHILKNTAKNYIRQFKVDGEVFPEGTPEPRCDYLLLDDTKPKSYYIELKGSDIPKAINQIENTVALLSPSIKKYEIFRATPHNSARVICEKILRQKKTQKCRNTLCISNFCNAFMTQNFRKAPQVQLCGVALDVSYTEREAIKSWIGK